MKDQIPDGLPAILQDVQLIKRLNYFDSLNSADIYSLELLQPLLHNYPVLPFTGFALRPVCIVNLINDILMNGRESILEFGSGISTILMGRLFKKNNLSGTIISVEHDQGWVESMNKMIRREKMEDIVKVVHAPLSKCSLSLDNNDWYDLGVLNAEIKDVAFDMVIIDGPPAWETPKLTARYPALPFAIKKLKAGFSIYLDDANRSGEQAIIKRWEKEYTMSFRFTGNNTLAYFHQGESFFTEPFNY